MCRSIKTLRPPVLPEKATEEDIRAAALQYVRKVSGFPARPRPQPGGLRAGRRGCRRRHAPAPRRPRRARRRAAAGHPHRDCVSRRRPAPGAPGRGGRRWRPLCRHAGPQRACLRDPPVAPAAVPPPGALQSRGGLAPGPGPGAARPRGPRRCPHPYARPGGSPLRGGGRRRAGGRAAQDVRRHAARQEQRHDRHARAEPGGAEPLAAAASRAPRCTTPMRRLPGRTTARTRGPCGAPRRHPATPRSGLPGRTAR